MLDLFQRLVFRLSPLSSRFVDQFQDFGPSAAPSERWAQELFLILSRAASPLSLLEVVGRPSRPLAGPEWKG